MRSEKTPVLVTGATGFVGSRLVRELAATNFDVHAIVRPGSSLKELTPVIAKVHVLEHNGCVGHLAGIIERVRPEVVFHLASLFVAEHRSEQVAELVDSNVTFGTQLLEAMAVNGIRNLVNAGTSWQHFGGELYRPVCLYAATKQAFEAVLDFYIDACGMRAITLKLFDTYGPEDPRPKLFSLLQSASQRDAVLDLSPGEQQIDLVYIDDVVEAFLQAGERLVRGIGDRKEQFAVTSQRPLTLRQIAETYSTLSGRKLKVNWGGRPYRAREVMIPWATTATLPGWVPRVSLEEGIRRIQSRLVAEL